jgi:hypothetical protein
MLIREARARNPGIFFSARAVAPALPASDNRSNYSHDFFVDTPRSSRYARLPRRLARLPGLRRCARLAEPAQNLKPLYWESLWLPKDSMPRRCIGELAEFLFKHRGQSDTSVNKECSEYARRVGSSPAISASLDMAGPGNDPVQVYRTGCANHGEFLRLWTGFELPSSCANPPGYVPNLNRNILDFMRWPHIGLGAQDLNDIQRPKSFQNIHSWK